MHLASNQCTVAKNKERAYLSFSCWTSCKRRLQLSPSKQPLEVSAFSHAGHIYHSYIKYPCDSCMFPTPFCTSLYIYIYKPFYTCSLPLPSLPQHMYTCMRTPSCCIHISRHPHPYCCCRQRDFIVTNNLLFLKWN